jgi:hypothetical protein
VVSYTYSHCIDDTSNADTIHSGSLTGNTFFNANIDRGNCDFDLLHIQPPKRCQVHQQVVGLRKFVRESLADVRELIAGKHANPAVVRQELARHIDSITLLPEGDGAVRYKGNWKLLGGREWCRGAELNCLRRPFQGRALPVSYLGTGTASNFTESAAQWEEKTAHVGKG